MVVVCGQRWRRSLDTLVRRPHCAIPVRKLPERLLHALRSFLPSSNNVACVRPGLQHAGLRRQAHAHQFLARTVNGKSTSLHSSGFLLLQQACRQQLITVSWLPLAVPGPLIPPTTLQTRNTPSYRYQLPNSNKNLCSSVASNWALRGPPRTARRPTDCERLPAGNLFDRQDRGS